MTFENTAHFNFSRVTGRKADFSPNILKRFFQNLKKKKNPEIAFSGDRNPSNNHV